MYDTLKLFEESVSDMTYIVPKQDNWTLEPVKAGKLTMAHGNLSDETFDSAAIQHFEDTGVDKTLRVVVMGYIRVVLMGYIPIRTM